MLVGEIITYFLFAFKIILSPIYAFILLGIMGFDWFIQFIGICPSTNTRRFITGIAGGIGVVSLFLKCITKMIRSFKKSKL